MTSTDAARPALDRSGSRIDHLNIAVPDLAAAVAFYEPVLACIGITKMLEIPAITVQDFPAMTGFGLAEVKPYFWLIDRGTVGTNMHVAFTVDTREAVDTFYAAALAAGATSRAAPASTPSTTTTTTADSSTTPTASTSKRSATTRAELDRPTRAVDPSSYDGG